MFLNFKFGRLLKGDQQKDFTYTTSHGNEADWSTRATSMTEPGTHWSVTIRNNMREDVLMLGSLRTEPTRFASIYSYDKYMMQDSNNMVVVELRMRDNVREKDGKSKVRTQSKIEIRCPGHYLQNNSLFIEELGCYLTVDSRLDATRELIAADARFPDARTTSVPEALVKPDPSKVFSDYEPLVRKCNERIDKIQVRVGVRVDVDPSRIPEHVKSLRIAVFDRNFSPYHHGKMCYDPSLTEDEFVVENISYHSTLPLTSTFEILHRQPARAFFLNEDEQKTLSGVLVGLAIFGDEIALYDYLFAHRSEEVYEELTQRLIDKNGSHALVKQIKDLEEILMERDSSIAELRAQNKFEQTQSKDYKRMVGQLEDSLKRIRTSHEENMGADVIMAEMRHQQEKMALEREKLDLEWEELKSSKEQAKRNHKASMFKTAADIAKSGWGIMVIVATAIAAIVKGYNKLKST